MIRRMKVSHGIALVAPVLGSLSACDLRGGDGEIPLRDQGVGGKEEVTGDFGRYTSDFDTRLRRGPGYR